MNWISLVKEVGPYLTIMAFFLYRDFRREEQQEKRINNLNEFIQKELVKLIEKTNEILSSFK